MFLKQLLCLSTAVALVLSIESRQEKKLHRLVGGHLRITNSDADYVEMLEANASGSKDRSPKKNNDEERKTLSHQVADGKYALIQNEIFSKPLRTPGVVSYDNNPEVPKDNINNLGGLTKNDIWLAENHLLVIKGGSYSEHDDKQDNSAPVWPAIDDFTASKRPVKIPENPKVPPPFPVQLTDDGPLQILGTNSSRTINGTFDATAFALPPPEGYVPGTGPYFPPPYPYSPNATAGAAENQNNEFPSGDYPAGAPFPPFPLNGTLPPFFASLPPGAVAVPPPGIIDQYDEDDPSIYYPPPYSFYYQKDNSSLVPAGPLVPGIILPPPPDFFAPLKPPRVPAPRRTTTRPKVQKTTQQSPHIHPTTTPLPPTSAFNNIPLKKPNQLLPIHVPSEINNELEPIVTARPISKMVTSSPVRQYPTKTSIPSRTTQKLQQAITILKPIKPIDNYSNGYNYYANQPNPKPFKVYGPPPPKTVISSTQVPLKIYYSTSNEIESNSVTRAPVKNHHDQGSEVKTKQPTEYYLYEEQKQKKAPNTRPNKNQNFFDIPNEYYVPAKQTNPPRSQVIYVTARPYTTSNPRYRFVQQTPRTDSFSIHVAKLKKQIHQYYTTPRPIFRQIHSPKPVYQYSFQAANYKARQNNFRPSQPDVDDEDKFRPMPKYSVQIQQGIEIVPTQQPQPIYKNPQAPVYFQQNFRANTEKPQPSKYYSTTHSQADDYDEEPKDNRFSGTPRPISQYAFESTQTPPYQAQYNTKSEENYFDDITKNHFTIFGNKIPTATTPLPVQYLTRSPNQVYNKQNQQSQRFQENPISLQADTVVNYLKPRPNINSHSEFVSVNENQQANYPQVSKYIPRPSDYIQGQRQINNENEPEIIKAIPISVSSNGERSGSYISYQLPGDDGAHFYFLTPQLAQRRDQGSGYYYTRPNNARSRRSESEDKG